VSWALTSRCREARNSSSLACRSALKEVDSRVQSVEGGTRLSTVYRGESRGFFKLAEPVMVRLTKQQFEAAADNMKALLESE